MKKVLAGLCAGAFALALIGCGEGGKPKPPKPNKPAATPEKPKPATPEKPAPKKGD